MLLVIEWGKFVLEQKLDDVIESVNCVSVMHSKYDFINYEKRIGFTTDAFININPRSH